GVGRPREAIDAAVLAAAIGIDRAVEGNVGGIVAGDDLGGGIVGHGGFERGQFLETLPAVIEGDGRERRGTARWGGLAGWGAAGGGGIRGGHLGVAGSVEGGGGGTRPRILRPRRRRAARKTARRRRGDGPGGRGRRRAFDGCVRASHGMNLQEGVEQNKNIIANDRRARGRHAKEKQSCRRGAGPPRPLDCWARDNGPPLPRP